jgi:serine phosphatase RsbU (regulator of sigma subunit)
MALVRCYLLFGVLVLFIPKINAQTPVLDSIQQLIGKAPNDSIMLKHMVSYAGELTYINPSKSKILLGQAIKKSQNMGFKRIEADALYYKAIAESFEGNYQESMKLMVDATSIYQKIGYEHGVAKCYGGIGNIYYFLNNFPKAIEYFENALKIYKKNNQTIGIAGCISNLGLIYQETNQLDKALEYQKKGLELEISKGNKRGIAISHISIASLLISMEKYIDAKINAQKAISISQLLKDSSTLSDGYLRLAECYRKQGFTDSAEFFINKTIDINYKIKAYHQLAYALETQINLFDSLGKYKGALISSRELLRIKDTLLNTEKTAQIIEMQTKFDSEKKEKENQLLTEQNRRQRINLYGLAIIILLVIIIAINFYNGRRKIRNANEALTILNSELQQQKEEIQTQAEDLQRANCAIQNQKELIEFNHRKITDSIVYASVIQSAMLPPVDSLGNYFSDFFIFNKPRDIVSGDFYWLKEKTDSIVFAVADCTGHGVPGSLLSIMGISYLNEIAGLNNELKPSKVLEELRDAVKSTLGRSLSPDIRKEGIEIAFCNYNPKSMTLMFGGAKLSLWIATNGTLKEYSADKMPIGLSMREYSFNTKEISLKKGDIIYLFTDGITDQLGAESGKKFMRKNFVEFLAQISNRPLANQEVSINEMFEKWKGEHLDQTDDILIIGLKV